MKRVQHTAVAIVGLGAVLLIGRAAWQWQAGNATSLVTPIMKRRPGRSAPKPVAPIQWRPASAAERQAAITSVTGQLEAFKKDNYDRAMFYQSSALRNNFASTETFREMIQAGYPQFANNRSARFGKARSDRKGGHMEIEVLVTGQDGSTKHAVYDLVLEENVFRVNGVLEGSLGHAGPMMPMMPKFHGLPGDRPHLDNPIKQNDDLFTGLSRFRHAPV